MEPEASVSALVFHHPDARYFTVGAENTGGHLDLDIGNERPVRRQ